MSRARLVAAMITAVGGLALSLPVVAPAAPGSHAPAVHAKKKKHCVKYKTTHGKRRCAKYK